MFVYFDKIVPEEELIDAKGAAAKTAPAKAPAQGGTATAEDLKPVYARGWLNLIPLLEPGVKSLTQRVFLQQVSGLQAPKTSESHIRSHPDSVVQSANELSYNSTEQHPDDIF